MAAKNPQNFDPTQQEFVELQKRFGITSRAKLGYGEFGRGLFADSDIEAGTLVLEVPLELCIIRQLDASDANLKVEGEMTVTQRKQLCWILEFFLTAELLQAISEGGEEFWLKYRIYLPEQDTPFPLLLEKGDLEHLAQCDASLVHTIERHRERLSSAWREQLGCPEPPLLRWANALVLSRCFHMYSKASVLGWLAPFVDMMNHSLAPNCSMTTSASSVQVVATRGVAAGEELLLCYAHFPSAHLFWRYGFVVPNNDAEALERPPGDASLCPLLLARFFDAHYPQDPPAPPAAAPEPQSESARARTLLAGLAAPQPATAPPPPPAAAAGAGTDGDTELGPSAGEREREAAAAAAVAAGLEAELAACRRVLSDPPLPADDRRSGCRAYAAERAAAVEEGLGLLRRYSAWLA